MKWLIRRVLTLWLTLVVICVAGIIVGRLNAAPNPLQRLGFGLCDGEACFRGIKLGVDWQGVVASFPKGNLIEDGTKLTISTENIQGVTLSNEGTASLKDMEIWENDLNGDRLPPLKTGDILTVYGRPCQMILLYSDGHANTLLMVYPTLTVGAWLLGDDPNDQMNVRLQPDSPMWQFQVRKPDQTTTCSDPTSEYNGPWLGFTSLDVYRARYQRDADPDQH